MVKYQLRTPYGVFFTKNRTIYSARTAPGNILRQKVILDMERHPV